MTESEGGAHELPHPAEALGEREADPFPHVDVQRDLGRARREWLLTNGAGAYASSTIAGMHTRRYHGLLVAALEPPRSRHVILSHVDVTVSSASRGGPTSRDGGRNGNGRNAASSTFELAKHQFPRVDPEGGPFYLERFDQDPLPRFTYAVAGGTLEVTLALVRAENAAILRYVWRGPESVMLTLRPLLAMRPFHDLQREHGGMMQRVELRANEVRVQPKRELPKVCFRAPGTFVGSPDWWRRFEYLTEHARGLDFHEDLWTPGLFEVRIDTAPAYLVAAVEKLPEGDAAELFAAASDAILETDPGPSRPLDERRLSIAAGVFRADLARRPGIIAGYPWFEVWGRDALVALPGLYLVPKRIDAALAILRELIASMRDGLVPSRIPDAGAAPEYLSADATLWLFEAARQVADATGDSHPFVTETLLLALTDAFDAALRGTQHGVRVTEEGLFAAGEPNDSLTWMDARVAGQAVTPRAGCPIELTALWAKGCETLARFARVARDQSLYERASAASKKARAAFRERFWCDETDYPFDVVSAEREGEGAFRDASIRPNAVMALAIDRDAFDAEQERKLLARAKSDLLTPSGLRTLAPSDPRYVGYYGGGVAARDEAYHQGTAWPFLLGFYVRAARRAGADRSELEALIATATANALCVGQIAEIADGEAPHAPNGAFAQAWSVAELLRAIASDLG